MSWTDCVLGDVVTLKRGHDLPKGKRQDGIVPVVSSSGITGWHNEVKAEPPGVVTGRYGTIGEVFYLDRPYWPLNTALYAIDFHGNDPRFVAYFLRNQLKNYKSEKAAVPGVDRNVLHKINVRCPDRPTQERIAGVLSAYDDLIENNRRRIALLEQAARLLYREWFVHFRFPGHETAKFVDGLPEGWRVGTIADLFDTSSGGTPSRKNDGFYGGHINWLKTQELQNCFIFDTDEQITEEALKRSSAKLFPENSVIIAMYGATIGQLGLLAKPSSTNQACCALLPKRSDQDFLFGYCLMEHSTRTLKDLGQGAAQNNVSQTVIRALEIVIPAEKIIDEFNVVVETNFLQRKNLQFQNTKLTAARDLLLPRLMDGRISV
ncbi:MAG: restriction endonuclease subunit S [Mameliella sp.]|nr:restriction endonuclease subunit S [Mameliella sp.]|tara:strand:- start:9025 stop:10155 length:1131 start_codon:yes stop_codon:yes gene_type:complete